MSRHPKTHRPDIYTHAMEIMRDNPKDVVYGYGGKYYLTARGLKLLDEALQYRHIPKGNVSLVVSDLATEYSLDIAVIRSCLCLVRVAHPDEFSPRGAKKPSATPKGRELLLQEIKRRLVPEGYVGFTLKEVAERYTIDRSTAARIVAEQSERTPTFFGKNDAGSLYATPEALEALDSEAKKRFQPREGFSYVMFAELASEFDLSYPTIRKFFMELSEQYPTYFYVAETRAHKFQATQEGVVLLRNALKHYTS